jgi:anthranilate phosphoribosyltransferase
MAAELAARGRNALVFRGSDGLDELTTTGNSEIWLVQGGVVTEFQLNPSDFGLEKVEISALLGGDARHNAEIARNLFADPGNPLNKPVREVVALNAAGGLVAYVLSKNKIESQQQLNDEFARQLVRVFDALDSGAAAEKLSAWMSATQA